MEDSACSVILLISPQRQRVADFPVRARSQIKASEAKEAAKNKPAEPKQQGSVAKKTTPSRPAESTPRATTGGKTMGAKGRAGHILRGVCLGKGRMPHPPPFLDFSIPFPNAALSMSRMRAPFSVV